MKIIKANETHIPEILEIYAKARKFMKENGNPTQWEEGYPSREIVEKDIAADHCYVCIENENVVGVFVFIIGEDPTYRIIYQGTWHSEAEYGTIHRIASDGTIKGLARICFDFCRQKCGYLRIDTHANNKPMQRAIRSYGFQECGIIHTRDGSDRIAFDYIGKNEDSSMEEMRTEEKQIVYDQALYEKAYEFAKKKHGTQKRIGGDPYITHPMAVADILKKKGYDIEYLIVALFHDLLEDTDATEDEIRSIAGEEVLQAVKLLTKEKGYDMQTYVTRIRQNPMAYAVKGADRLHNLRSAFCTSRHFRQKYITETETWYLSFHPDIPAEVEKLKQTLADENIDNRFSQSSSE